MNCFRHMDRVATAICVECGQAVCNDCRVLSKGSRVTCSAGCAAEASRVRDVINSIENKTRRGSLITAWFLWASGGLFIIAGGIASLTLHDFFVAPMAIGVVFLVAGYFYFRVSRRDN